MRTLLLALLLLVPTLTHAQQRESSLSDGEIEKLRDTAYDPPARLLAFTTFLDQRSGDIDRSSPPASAAPAAKQDIHDDMEQFSSIAEDLEDNLDDYGKRHKDVRKVLPKLLAATERWRTTLQTPPDNDAYNVSRKLALGNLDDLRETATKLLDEQKAYFLAHPPAKSPTAPPIPADRPARSAHPQASHSDLKWRPASALVQTKQAYPPHPRMLS